MTLPTVSPAEASRLARAGGRIVDVRSPDEFARVRIPGADNRPLDSLSKIEAPGPIVFHCRSGMRTSANAARLAACCDGEAYVLDGGIDAWRKAGLAVEEDKGAPLEIMRQVQIVAGSLVLVGVLLGFTVAPAWFALSGFVGAGLTFAGVSGWCGMARLLALMPWNHRQPVAS
ncbi:membrane protein [Tsuneonella deserti]|uniref:Membrane protein n=1 Tax=Tsuneonella deserti TaxID=2035528 RepID=A0ABQ1SDB1_9SPHN|nr:rhodanese family protein [Tsuneonella deserti]GGE02026.1 membrane protein [Tsuneonella deserti]